MDFYHNKRLSFNALTLVLLIIILVLAPFAEKLKCFNVEFIKSQDTIFVRQSL